MRKTNFAEPNVRGFAAKTQNLRKIHMEINISAKIDPLKSLNAKIAII